MKRRTVFVVGVVVGVLAAGTVAVARDMAPQPRRVIACADQTTGELRVVDSGDECESGEERIAWNKRGPRGPQGEPGESGIAGPAGERGPRGPVASTPKPVLRDANDVFLGEIIQGSVGGESLVWDGTQFHFYLNTGERDTLTYQVYFESNDCSGSPLVEEEARFYFLTRLDKYGIDAVIPSLTGWREAAIDLQASRRLLSVGSTIGNGPESSCAPLESSYYVVPAAYVGPSIAPVPFPLKVAMEPSLP